METVYINRDGKELTKDDLYTVWARHNFVIDHKGFEKWIESRIESGSLKVKGVMK